MQDVPASATEDADIIARAFALILKGRSDDACSVLATLSSTDPVKPYDDSASTHRTLPPLRRVHVGTRTLVACFERDGWRCRYCGRKVVFPYALLLLTTLCPGFKGALPEFRFKTGTFEPAIERVYPTLDHVEARVHDPNNYVTACSPCNYRKSDRLGWIPRAVPAGDAWDGLVAAYLELISLRPDLLTSMQRTWIAALSFVRSQR